MDRNWLIYMLGMLFIVFGGSALEKYINQDTNFIKECGKTCKTKVLEANPKTYTCKCYQVKEIR